VVFKFAMLYLGNGARYSQTRNVTTWSPGANILKCAPRQNFRHRPNLLSSQMTIFVILRKRLWSHEISQISSRRFALPLCLLGCCAQGTPLDTAQVTINHQANVIYGLSIATKCVDLERQFNSRLCRQIYVYCDETVEARMIMRFPLCSTIGLPQLLSSTNKMECIRISSIISY